MVWIITPAMVNSVSLEHVNEEDIFESNLKMGTRTKKGTFDESETLWTQKTTEFGHLPGQGHFGHSTRHT